MLSGAFPTEHIASDLLDHENHNFLSSPARGHSLIFKPALFHFFSFCFQFLSFCFSMFLPPAVLHWWIWWRVLGQIRQWCRLKTAGRIEYYQFLSQFIVIGWWIPRTAAPGVLVTKQLEPQWWPDDAWQKRRKKRQRRKTRQERTNDRTLCFLVKDVC